MTSKGRSIKISEEQKVVLKATFKRRPYIENIPVSLKRVSVRTGLREEHVVRWFQKRREALGTKRKSYEEEEIQILDNESVEPDSGLNEGDLDEDVDLEDEDYIFVDEELEYEVDDADEDIEISVTSTSGPVMSSEEKASEYDRLKDQIEKMKNEMHQMSQTFDKRQMILSRPTSTPSPAPVAVPSPSPRHLLQHQPLPSQCNRGAFEDSYQQQHLQLGFGQQQQMFHPQYQQNPLPYPRYDYDQYHLPQVYPYNPYSSWNLPYPPPDFQIVIFPVERDEVPISYPETVQEPVIRNIFDDSSNHTGSEIEMEGLESNILEIEENQNLNLESNETIEHNVDLEVLPVENNIVDKLETFEELSTHKDEDLHSEKSVVNEEVTNEDEVLIEDASYNPFKVSDEVSEEVTSENVKKNELVDIVDNFVGEITNDSLVTSDASHIKASNIEQDEGDESETLEKRQDSIGASSPKKKYRLTPFKDRNKNTANNDDIEKSLEKFEKELSDFEKDLDINVEAPEKDNDAIVNESVPSETNLEEVCDNTDSNVSESVRDEAKDDSIILEAEVPSTPVTSQQQQDKSIFFQEIGLSTSDSAKQKEKVSENLSFDEALTFPLEEASESTEDILPALEYDGGNSASTSTVNTPTPFVVKQEPQEAAVKETRKVGRRSLPNKPRPVNHPPNHVNQVNHRIHQQQQQPPKQQSRFVTVLQPDSTVIPSQVQQRPPQVLQRYPQTHLRPEVTPSTRVAQPVNQRLPSSPVVQNPYPQPPRQWRGAPPKQSQPRAAQTNPRPAQQQPRSNQAQVGGVKRKTKEPTSQGRSKAVKGSPAAFLPNIGTTITVTKVVPPPTPPPPKPVPVTDPASRPEIQRILKMSNLSVSIKR